jgi:hypothetical protein
MVTLFSSLKSMHNLKVPFFVFTKITRAPQGYTLGHIYPSLNSYSSCIYNPFNYGVLIMYGIMYGVLDTRVAPDTRSMDMSMSLFGGNPRIPPKKSPKSFKTKCSFFNTYHFIFGCLFHMGCKDLTFLPQTLFQLLIQIYEQNEMKHKFITLTHI